MNEQQSLVEKVNKDIQAMQKLRQDEEMAGYYALERNGFQVWRRPLKPEDKPYEGHEPDFSDIPACYHRLRPKPGTEEADKRKLNIGLLLPALTRAIVMGWLYAYIAAYNREKYNVVLYIDAPEDEISRSLQEKAAGVRQVPSLVGGMIAWHIQKDFIDILLDFTDSKAGGTLPAVAYKPAPLQIAAGRRESSGLPQFDYLLGSDFVDKENLNGQEAFIEEILRINHPLGCFTPLTETDILVKSTNKQLTLGNVRGVKFISSEVLSAWKLLLEALPQARLLLVDSSLAQNEKKQELMEKLEQAELPMARIDLWAKGNAELFSEYQNMDIFLDTFPFSTGLETVCESLYMGVPVVTLAGKEHSSRLGAEALKAIGVQELVAHNADEYVKIILSLARDQGLRLALQPQLRTLLQESSLTDAAGFTSELEKTFQHIWKCYQDKAYISPTLQEQPPLLLQMVKFIDKNDWRQALAIADKLSLDEDLPPASIAAVADTYLDGKDFSNGRKQAERLQKTKSNRRLKGYAHYLLGKVAYEEDDSETARRELQLVVKNKYMAKWQRAFACQMLAKACFALGYADEAAKATLTAVRLHEKPANRIADYTAYIFCLHYAPHSAEELFRNTKKCGELLKKTAKPCQPRNFTSRPKIRVGYISPDFRKHVVADFAIAFFTGANKEKFEVYGYSVTPMMEITRFFASKADHWRDLYGYTPDKAAELVRQDELDILVDLSGYTAGSCLPICACQPAPIQLCGIGWFATTGLSTMQGFLVDKYTALPAEDKYFSEKLIRVAHSHFCFRPMKMELGGEVPPLAHTPCLENGHISFGSFNNARKLTVEVLSVWAKIMQALPDSTLYLKAGEFRKESGINRIKKRLEQVGISEDRVTFEAPSTDYRLCYHRMDIALDTFPYPGGGTTCDALYMGIPVITLSGSSHHERFGTSLLANVNLMDECVADNVDEFVAKAIALANNQALLDELHCGEKNIRVRMQNSPLGNPKLYMQDLEAEYERLYDKWHESVK